MTNLTVFKFEDIQDVRVVMLNETPWFVATDVCKILGIKNTSDTMSRIDSEDTQTIDYSIVAITYSRENQSLSAFDPKKIIVVNESGLYSLVLFSRKPEAKKFKRWITSEVVPSVRKTGQYSIVAPAKPIELTRLQLIEMALAAEKERLVLEAKVQELEPKAVALDRIAESKGSQCITDAAKALKVQPCKLFEILVNKKWIYKRDGGKNWLGYQDKIESGLLEHNIVVIGSMSREQVLLTSKGITKIAQVLGGTITVQARLW